MITAREACIAILDAVKQATVVRSYTRKGRPVRGYTQLREAKSLFELETSLREMFPETLFGLRSLDLRAANELASEFVRLRRKYPEVKIEYFGSAVGSTLGRLQVFGELRRRLGKSRWRKLHGQLAWTQMPFGGAVASAKEGCIFLSASNLYSYGKFMRAQGIAHKSNWSVIASPRDVVTHEFGHLLDDHFGKVSRLIRDDADPVSTYGWEHPREAWAEGFVSLERGKRNGYTRAMLRIIQKLRRGRR